MKYGIDCIVVGYDGFDRKEPIPAYAVALARVHQARLVVVHVTYEPPHSIWLPRDFAGQELHAELMAERLEQLHGVVEPLRRTGIDVRAIVRSGTPHIEIIREAISSKADLVVVADEPLEGGRGFGTVTSKLLRLCPVPILAKRAIDKVKHQHILAAVDLAHSTTDVEACVNRRVVELAATLATHAGSQLTLFHAWSLWGEKLMRGRGRSSAEMLDSALSEIEARRETDLELLLTKVRLSFVELDIAMLLQKGDVRRLLPQLVDERNVDLVVMGTVSRGGLPGLLIGNTAEKLINSLSCSVLAVKPDSFVSPIKA
jgi:universal stress protein E